MQSYTAMTHPPGVELDRLIHVRVLRNDPGDHPVEAYSTSWEAAGRLAEHLQQQQWAVRWSNKTADWCWWAYVWYYGDPDIAYPGLKTDGTGQGDTGPHALCLSILNAMEAKESAV